MDKRLSSNQEAEVRKGPWTMEEDLILINYIANHGEGVWNNLAKSAGILLPDQLVDGSFLLFLPCIFSFLSCFTCFFSFSFSAVYLCI